MSEIAGSYLNSSPRNFFIFLFFLYKCCCRRKTNEDKDAERGSDHFVLDNIDGTKKESVVLVNDGFDSQEDNDPPVGQLL